MKLTKRNLKFAWKYRNYLWKYRGLIRRRREIAGAAAALGVIATGVFLRRRAASNRAIEAGAS